MKHTILLKNSKIRELLQLDDVDSQYKYMLAANPYIKDDDYPGRIEGYVDDALAGAVFTTSGI